MGGSVDTIKSRLDIAEVVSGYLKLEKAGVNLKARCPFHNEKTASFFVSPSRQSFYCFGCGAKGDMFTFIEEMEGVDFRGALKLLADKAGVELEKVRGEHMKLSEKDELYEVLEAATTFFEGELEKDVHALEYLKMRGINNSSIKDWRLGLAPDEWRGLYSHLTKLGFKKELIIKAGLAKQPEKEGGEKSPYDIFRARIIFPLSDTMGRVVAFSGRALGDAMPARHASQGEAGGPKYLNSPDTPLFYKSELLYGLHLAKDEIRRKDYAVLVEGQIDLVLSHQSGVKNTVASSGTAFTQAHLERLKKLSPRIILAFDGDEAGDRAREKSAYLALALGMDPKIAKIPEGTDPAELVQKNPEIWRNTLRESEPAIEYFLGRILENVKDPRKAGKLIEKSILPLIGLLQSSIERSHFITLVSKRAGIREEVVWEDLKRIINKTASAGSVEGLEVKTGKSPAKKNNIERRLVGIIWWQENLPQPLLDIATLKNEIIKRTSEDYFKNLLIELETEREVLIFEAESYYSNPERIAKEVTELLFNFSDDLIRGRLAHALAALARAESLKDEAEVSRLSEEVQAIHVEMRAMEDKRKVL